VIVSQKKSSAKSSVEPNAGLSSLVGVIEAAQCDVEHLVQETAQAVSAIIGAVETILADENFLQVDSDGALSDRLIGILQACSFQDLTGQRLVRVVEALQDSHARFSEGSVSARLSKAQKLRAKRRSDRLAHGPQLDDSGVDQSSIDSLFD
jgi:chemotaxis protein CheZ